MIEKLWYERSLLGFFLYPILLPLGKLYKMISERRRNAYLSGMKSRYKSPVPIIIVGNITAGGNGKTPVVIWLVERLKEMGFKPGVVSRGYGGKSDTYPLNVTDQINANQCGDEPKLIASRTGVPVSVDPVRSEAVKQLLLESVDVIISDDGLQHYALDRDIEFVVVDGKRRFGNRKFIPQGPLREGLDRLSSVDFVINNGGVADEGELSMILVPELAINLVNGEKKSVSQLQNLKAFAGIGHPPRFFSTLNQLGANPVETVSFADHQDFDEQTLKPFAEHDGDIIMTEKDAVKCKQLARANWWYLPVSAQFSSEEAEQITKRIEEVIASYGS
ncbi:tetraacyldisaccharide 4'-kinase [Vibrio sp.]|uniref:Tetraacyldisaccharide 4'-kinase n=1 Tax=Vibrio viridaestus TaxID=2487322 RepID=A0A3N9TG72_9VIBR|nr:tetraacyldisaccharide 4'-kinase [Vibrio viridaestus]MDC0612594.1 tetraacyldisaccharide 4'-kinase [Vibrio sp.]RQW63258.1 tetraacyldisaccharide 4'-kinase [Vibrio viridaestus]